MGQGIKAHEVLESAKVVLLPRKRYYHLCEAVLPLERYYRLCEAVLPPKRYYRLFEAVLPLVRGNSRDPSWTLFLRAKPTLCGQNLPRGGFCSKFRPQGSTYK